MIRRRLSFALLLTAGLMLGSAAAGFAQSGSTQSAQAQPSPSQTSTPPPTPTQPATGAQQTAPEPIGNVATLTGSATVTRNSETSALKPKDDIYAEDMVATAAKSKLAITFNDATTFNMSANATMTIDSYLYEEGGKQNNAVFDVAKGTIAFVAAAVAKTGDMTISTPTATLGIRGTTGLIEVPEDGAAAANPKNVAIKLYPDADGRVGQIDINDRNGVRLGALTRGASGFTIQPGTGGARFTAVPLVIPPQQLLRDQGFVRQVHAAQDLGRRVVEQQRTFRRANPGLTNPNRGNAHGQPRPNGAPGQNRTTPPQPGAPNRPGSTQPPGTRQQGTQQPGQGAATPRSGQALPGQPGGAPLPSPKQPRGLEPGIRQPPSAPEPQPAVSPRQGQPQQPNVPVPAGAPPRVGTQPPGAAPPAIQQPRGPQQAQPRLPGILRGAPGAARRPPPKNGKPPKELR